MITLTVTPQVGMRDALQGKQMRIALTIFGGTISPLFDAAQRLLLVDIEQGEVHKRFETSIGELDPAERLWVLTHHKVNVLICGAISSFLHQAFHERGVQVYPWITGEWADVLDCLAQRFKSVGFDEQPRPVAVTADSAASGAQVAQSFRVCSHFLLFEERCGDPMVIGHHDQSTCARVGCCAVARRLIDARVKVLLTGRCGPNALGMLAAAGIHTVQGVDGPAAAAAESYLRGEHSAQEHQGSMAMLRQPCIQNRSGAISDKRGRRGRHNRRKPKQ